MIEQQNISEGKFENVNKHFPADSHAPQSQTANDRTSILLVRALGLFTGILLVAGMMISQSQFFQQSYAID